MKKMLLYFLTFVCLSLFAFQNLDEREILVQERLKEKLDKFKKNQLEDCQQDILKAATAKVDSMLLAQAKLKTVDPVKKPFTPSKPNKPLIKKPKDTSDIVPIIKE